jgi:glyoxylase-like metal-dependent hydrolase (beta-lactamase superfamily II)
MIADVVSLGAGDIMRRGRLRRVAAGVAALVLGSACITHAASPPWMKLYVFSSGALTVPRSLLQNGADNSAVQVPVGFYVIKHPKGNVLFDTGNNDRIITDPAYWGPFIKGINPVRTPDLAITVQLARIGLKPDDIRYVVVSHFHLDHGGNAHQFPNSTLVAQMDEIRNAFWPEPGTAGPYIPGDLAYLRSELGASLPNRVKMIQLNGDLDLFGDGSAVVKRWVGHTPGSQMMIVRLPKTGTIVLTGDTVYLRENVEKNILPSVALAYDPVGIMNAYEFIRQIQATEGADFFTAHDPDAFEAQKKAPAYYE